MTRAPFLSLDGIDGTGKSTQCRLIVDWLTRSGLSVVACADPGGTPLGDQLRQILLATDHEITDRAEALLFMASRAELVTRIIQPALDAGRMVVCDRFVAANVAYQGYGRGLSPNELWQVGQFSTGGLLPDLTIILDLDVKAAMARRSRPADRMEGRGADYLERVRQGFRTEARAQPDRVQVVDAGADKQTVQQRLREVIGGFLRTRGITVRDES